MTEIKCIYTIDDFRSAAKLIAESIGNETPDAAATRIFELCCCARSNAFAEVHIVHGDEAAANRCGVTTRIAMEDAVRGLK